MSRPIGPMRLRRALGGFAQSFLSVPCRISSRWRLTPTNP